MKKSFRVIAIAVSALMLTCFMVSCSGEKENNSVPAETTQATTTTVTTVAETTIETTAEVTTTVAETEHISPTETVTINSGFEKTNINEMMDYDKNKNFKIKLSDFAQEGDKINSFTFVFYSADGTSDMGDYTGACGISVSEDCKEATDEGWYQSEDFVKSTEGAYAEITWEVPDSIKNDIEISDEGFIQIGYWWSNVKQLKLSSVICNYTRTATIPVDNTSSTEVNQTLKYENDDTKTAEIPLSSILANGDIPQVITFNIQSEKPLGKFVGGFGISVTEDCFAANDEGWYQADDVSIMTDSSNAEISWIIPDEIKDCINPDGNVNLGYWWSEGGSVTLNSITAKSSNSNGTSVPSEPAETLKENNFQSSDKNISEMTSAEIVEDMRVGWNLGNTLESYDVEKAENAETAWGNPVTTKEMIDWVKSAGFNAVRIPVSWGEHMNESDTEYTIHTDWMNRVKEVVDYALDNDMYVTLNVHHDDYIWLTPTRSAEKSVTEKYVAIWKQICETFKDYDEHLLFEGLNEPRIIGGQDEWTCGTEEEREVINNLLQKFVDTVRASGGKNTTRHLIITSHAASTDKTSVESIKIPDDERIIVSLHHYAPWDFVGEESNVSQWGSAEEKKALDETFDYLHDKFIKNGTPVIIGEFGTVNKNNTSVRAEYMEYYIESANKRDITCFVWDDGGKFKLLNRGRKTWQYPEIINGIMDGLD